MRALPSCRWGLEEHRTLPGLVRPSRVRRRTGLCDAAEEGDFRRGLERAGVGSNLTRAEMERLGFYVCVADLEDELIRSLGAAAVERVIDAQGDLDIVPNIPKQPAWQGRTKEEQLRRFFGTHSGRKIQSASLLVDALDLTGCLGRWIASSRMSDASNE